MDIKPYANPHDSVLLLLVSDVVHHDANLDSVERFTLAALRHTIKIFITHSVPEGLVKLRNRESQVALPAQNPKA